MIGSVLRRRRISWCSRSAAASAARRSTSAAPPAATSSTVKEDGLTYLVNLHGLPRYGPLPRPAADAAPGAHPGRRPPLPQPLRLHGHDDGRRPGRRIARPRRRSTSRRRTSSGRTAIWRRTASRRAGAVGRRHRPSRATGAPHRLVQADCLRWVADAEGTYDLIWLDPPTFSNSKKMGRATFDVQRDHADLIRMTARRLLAPGGTLLFATNRRGFKLDPRTSAACGQGSLALHAAVRLRARRQPSPRVQPQAQTRLRSARPASSASTGRTGSRPWRSHAAVRRRVRIDGHARRSTAETMRHPPAYGSWRSPITARLIAEIRRRARRAAGGGGRTVLGRDAPARRTGGTCWCEGARRDDRRRHAGRAQRADARPRVRRRLLRAARRRRRDVTVFFSEFEDQRLYRQDVGADGGGHRARADHAGAGDAARAALRRRTRHARRPHARLRARAARGRRGRQRARRAADRRPDRRRGARGRGHRPRLLRGAAPQPGRAHDWPGSAGITRRCRGTAPSCGWRS